MRTLANLGLTEQGLISATEVIYNAAYEVLYNAELSDDAQGFEKGCLTSLGAVAVNTGRFTGRSPKDKYVVRTSTTHDTIWWQESGSDNQPMTPEVWKELKGIALDRLNGQKLYVMDGYCGANPNTRLKVRLVTEVAWMAHFFKNMFIRPEPAELDNFEADWTIFNACKTTCENYQALGLNSEVFVAFNVDERMTLIGGTWYGGEIKKGIFSMMNYFLPLQGIGAFHCSANQGEDGSTALFFGLSGTGKTTLSTDPHRALIGDDEHGWDDEGIFNFEGGCYAKLIHLSEKKEPDIYHALRSDALLENVVTDAQGNVDFDDGSKTENTRASYPIYHIDNIVKPVSRGGHPQHIIFLTCDAFGVLPPVSKLSKEQAMFHFLSGYTAKVAGTEIGVTEPTVTFSACFGQPFLTLHPHYYAAILGQKIDTHQAKTYLVNTGWTHGPYGKGHRISIKATRAIINAILNGDIEDCATQVVPYLDLTVPTALPDVPIDILNPREVWEDKDAYDTAAQKLADMFGENFKKFT